MASCTVAEMVVDPPTALTFGGVAVKAVMTGFFALVAPPALSAASKPLPNPASSVAIAAHTSRRRTGIEIPPG